MRIRKGDSVVIISGEGKRIASKPGSGGPYKVLQVLDGGERLLVEGVNKVHKHVRRGHPKSPQGGRLHLEMPIAASRCMYFCESCNKAVRVGYRYDTDGQKERHCRSCGASAGSIGKPRPQYASK